MARLVVVRRTLAEDRGGRRFWLEAGTTLTAVSVPFDGAVWLKAECGGVRVVVSAADVAREQ